jgi:probable rRNA maturation factor
MSQSPIENATDVHVDLENLATVYQSIAKALQMTRPIAVRLVDSAEMVQLNTSFRQCPENTDVLTFPSGLDDPLPLGDIAICVPYAIDQANLRKVPLENELIALLVHGCLHIVGYDDITDEDRTEMQHKMNEVGATIGIPIDGEWTSILHQDHE